MNPLELLHKTSWIVGACEWRVIHTDEPIAGDSLCAGMCDSLKGEISIRSDMPPQMRLRTLFHELTHAAGLSETVAGHAEVIAAILMDNEGRREDWE